MLQQLLPTLQLLIILNAVTALIKWGHFFPASAEFLCLSMCGRPRREEGSFKVHSSKQIQKKSKLIHQHLIFLIFSASGKMLFVALLIHLVCLLLIATLPCAQQNCQIYAKMKISNKSNEQHLALPHQFIQLLIATHSCMQLNLG